MSRKLPEPRIQRNNARTQSAKHVVLSPGYGIGAIRAIPLTMKKVEDETGYAFENVNAFTVFSIPFGKSAKAEAPVVDFLALGTTVKAGPLLVLFGDGVNAFSYWVMRSMGVDVCGAASLLNPLAEAAPELE
ncbi:MAG: hypothetical protein Q9187_001660 [Circinaria calcarea]